MQRESISNRKVEPDFLSEKKRLKRKEMKQKAE